MKPLCTKRSIDHRRIEDYIVENASDEGECNSNAVAYDDNDDGVADEGEMQFTSDNFCRASLEPNVLPDSRCTSSGRILHDMLFKSAISFICLKKD